MERRQDWGEAPDPTGFVGRADELLTLSSWVLDLRCRLLVLFGIGGIGKTSLAARLAHDVAPGFERVYWRSVRDGLPPADWLAGAIGFLSDHQLVPPPSESERLTAVLQLLRERRCLLVLDNCETLFEPGQQQDAYRPGLAGYGRLLEVAATAAHRSCVILTSREAPSGLAALGDAVRTLRLGGLGVDETQALLAPKHLEGTSAEWAELVAHFGGNGLALKVASESIRELFGGTIGEFLEEARASNILGAIGRLLREQVERSSVPEQQVLRVLAIEREPMRLPALLAAAGPRVGRAAVLEALEALRRRSLVERAETPAPAAFTLHSVVLEYVTDRLVEAVADEIARSQPELLVEQPLIMAQAKDYLREVQERLIGVPIVQRLRTHHQDGGTQQRLLALLDAWRDRPPEQQGYGPGNVVNLLRLVRGDVRGLNLSRLTIRQAYLAEVDAQDARLVATHLSDSVLAEAFDFPSSVALSGDGTLLAAGTSTGEVRVWRVADRTPVWAAQGHTATVFSVALSANAELLASGSADGVIGVWGVGTGDPVATLHGQTGSVWGVALSADGRLLASGGADGTVRLWEARTGRLLVTLSGHAGAVRSVALAADGELAASGGEDGTVSLWDTRTGRLLTTLRGRSGPILVVALADDGTLLASGGQDGMVSLWDPRTGRLLSTQQGHTGGVWGVAVSADGRLAVSVGPDGAVRLWDTSTGSPLAALQGNTSMIFDVALSGDGRLVATGAGDGTVRLWEASTGLPLVSLHSHTSPVWAVALSGDGRLVASGGGDGTARLWDADTGRSLGTLSGHTGTTFSVALSANGRLVASGGGDGTVRLWEASACRLLTTLDGHTSTVWAVALSADGRLVASGSGDGTVRLWEVSTGRLLATLEGHTSAAWAVALSGDGRLVASGGGDGTVRLWEASTGLALASLQSHSMAVRGVALSTDGHLLASGGEDGTVRLWATATARPLATLQGHAAAVRGVALSTDGHLLASGSEDGTVRLWATATARPLAILRGHTAAVRGVALSAQGHLVVSGGFDHTLRVWEASTGACRHVLRVDRRYERLDITGLTGVTDAQRAALLALGAVEQHGSGGESSARLPLESAR
ncbi:MAG: hypothetical protein JOZ87_41700 [Chloroflexi bacterium]|nr:hypothetical protein [Chloroflexota bacterium]